MKITKINFFVLLSSFLLLVIVGCSSEVNVTDPEERIHSSTEVLPKKAVPTNKGDIMLQLLPEEGYFYKISPPNGSVQWQNMLFSWAQAKNSFVSGGKLYEFSQYRLTIDGAYKFSTYSIGTTSYNINQQEDGELHNWQLFADYVYSGGTYSVPYDFGDEWQIRIGLKTPVISGSWSNNHPYITWDAVPGATGYLIIPSYGGYSILTSNNFLDTNYTGPGSSQTISYYIYAFNGTWPISCISSPLSNTVFFTVN